MLYKTILLTAVFTACILIYAFGKILIAHNELVRKPIMVMCPAFHEARAQTTGRMILVSCAPNRRVTELQRTFTIYPDDHTR